MIGTILLVFAFVLSLIEAGRGWLGTWPAPHLGWLAVALYFLALVLQGTGVR